MLDQKWVKILIPRLNLPFKPVSINLSKSKNKNSDDYYNLLCIFKKNQRLRLRL